jgi:hypothetical protein
MKIIGEKRYLSGWLSGKDIAKFSDHRLANRNPEHTNSTANSLMHACAI